MAKKVNTKKQEGRSLLPVRWLKSSTTDADLAIRFTTYVELMDQLECEKKEAKEVADLLERAAAMLRCPDDDLEMGELIGISKVDTSLLVGFDARIKELSNDVALLHNELVNEEDTRRLVEFLDRKAA